MADSDDIPQPESKFYAVITGANSGVGLAIGCRLIEEFLQLRPQSQTLVLITTTRSTAKGDETVKKLQEHLTKTCRRAEKAVPGITPILLKRVQFRPEILDLTNLISVQRLSKKLREEVEKLDAVICNAGIGGWTDLHWGSAVWEILTSIKNGVTYPSYKIAGKGWVTKPQIPILENGEKVEEPVLGEVFCANFFGHYMFGHYLAPLLARHTREEKTRGRLIWVSSLESYNHSFDLSNMQAIDTDHPYESTKRQTDILAVTSALRSTRRSVDQYFDHAEDTATTTKPRIYLAHPGICGTTIFQLNIFLEYCMFFVMYLARWAGSMWHPVDPMKGAVSMVWLALARQGTLDSMEAGGGIGKWGSATNFSGEERVERTEVDGWGWGGTIEERNKKREGRSPYAKDLTPEDRKKFEELGVQTWIETEKLRIEWEKRLEAAGVGIKMD